MSTITARSVRRMADKSNLGMARGARMVPSILAFLSLAAKANMSHGVRGNIKGARMPVLVTKAGTLTTVSFRHPTKAATHGRYGSLSWVAKAAA